jgi:transposase
VLWELSVVEQRYTAIQEVLGGMPVTQVAERYGVSRQSVHAWLRRYQAGGLAGLEDRSHRPRSCPHQASIQVEAAVCELRRQHPGWGPLRLQHELVRRGVAPVPSRAGVYRILVRHRLVEPGRRRRRRSDFRRWERDRPMQLWQLDIVGRVLLADGTECKLVSGIDDHSRFCVLAVLVARATGRAVCAAFAAALGRYGVPQEVLSDNGRQFTGRFGKPRPAEVLFDRICRENGITHRLTGVRSRPPPARWSGSTRPSGPSCWPPCHHSPAWRSPRRSSTTGSRTTTPAGPTKRWACKPPPSASTPLPLPAATACRFGCRPSCWHRLPSGWARWSSS